MGASIYLYSGPEIGERAEAVEAVKRDLKKKYASLETYTYYSVETPLLAAMEKLFTQSLFSDTTCVVYNGAEAIKKKDEIQKLADWAEGADASSVLILVSDEISCDAKLEKIIPKKNRRQFWEMFDEQKIPWLKNYFSKNGYSIQTDACEEILDLVENNTHALKIECSRFFVCFPKGTVITPAEVEAVIEHGREESAFTLFDALCNTGKDESARLENAISILQKIRLSKDSSPVMIIAGLSFCFRRLEVWHKMRSAGQMGDMRKMGFASKKSQKQYSAAASTWTTGQTAAIKALLAQTDMDIRASGSAFEDTLLELLLYSIVMKGGGFLAACPHGW